MTTPPPTDPQPAQHSPLPWTHQPGMIFSAPTPGGNGLKPSPCYVAQLRGWGHLSYLGDERAAAIQEANATLIVTAVNQHQSLVDEVARLRAARVAISC